MSARAMRIKRHFRSNTDAVRNADVLRKKLFFKSLFFLHRGCIFRYSYPRDGAIAVCPDAPDLARDLRRGSSQALHFRHENDPFSAGRRDRADSFLDDFLTMSPRKEPTHIPE